MALCLVAAFQGPWAGAVAFQAAAHTAPGPGNIWNYFFGGLAGLLVGVACAIWAVFISRIGRAWLVSLLVAPAAAAIISAAVAHFLA